MGYASPSRMLREMRPSEYGMWIAIYNRDPWGERRADLRSALVALQISKGLLKGKFSLQQFMPFDDPPQKMSDLDRLRTQFAGKIKTVKRKGKK